MASVRYRTAQDEKLFKAPSSHDPVLRLSLEQKDTEICFSLLVGRLDRLNKCNCGQVQYQVAYSKCRQSEQVWYFLKAMIRVMDLLVAKMLSEYNVKCYSLRK